jgi:phage baseplate assembly protein gpV
MADSRLHQGQASERDVNSASARVAMDDLGGTVSGKMQVLFPAAGGWNFFWTPKEGDHVVISRLPNGTQEGYVLGKVYTANKMPQGGEPNIILIVSDDGKNVIRFNADNGTLDLVVDQTMTEKINNVEMEIKENRKIEIGVDDDLTIGGNQTTEIKENHKTKIGIDDDLTIEGNQTTEVTGNSKHKSADTDIVSEAPVGLQGTFTELGTDVLQIFFDDLISAVTRNPVIIPPVPLPKGVPVPPVPPIINMHLKAVWDDIVAAASKAKASCAKALK